MKTIKRTVIGAAVGATLFLACFIAAGQDTKTVDRVMLKDGIMKVVQGGQTSDMEKEVKLQHDITVMTNGTFKVKDGKERALQEGQILSADGMLTSPDGSIVPVFDNILAKNGLSMITRDGETTPLASNFTLGDGRIITPDGYIIQRDGLRLKLLDGQMYQLDGKAILAKDSVTLREGKVWVQKDGAQFEVMPGRSLMMNDGTKVLGDGTVVMTDGTQRKLAEGEILTLQGVVRKYKLPP